MHSSLPAYPGVIQVTLAVTRNKAFWHALLLQLMQQANPSSLHVPSETLGTDLCSFTVTAVAGDTT